MMHKSAKEDPTGATNDTDDALLSNRRLLHHADASSLSPSRSSDSNDMSLRKNLANYSSRAADSNDDTSGRRQRRRIDTVDPASNRASLSGSEYQDHADQAQSSRRRRSFSSTGSLPSEDESFFADAMGELSLNEDKQVKYFGRASGLYILGDKERLDMRNEGGIWCVVFLFHIYVPVNLDRFVL